MQEFLAGKNARLLVATISDYGPPGPEEYRLMSDGMRTAGIEELDVVYRGEETRPEKLMVGRNGHPGARIHAWWAEKLGAWLATGIPVARLSFHLVAWVDSSALP